MEREFMYSKKALRAARTSWNTLSSLMDKTPLVFKEDKTFKTFYDELAKKIMNSKEKD